MRFWFYLSDWSGSTAATYHPCVLYLYNIKRPSNHSTPSCCLSYHAKHSHCSRILFQCHGTLPSCSH